MMLRLTSTTCWAFMLLVIVDAYQDGAPASACVDMSPNHGAAAQKQPTFQLEAYSTTYSPGQKINVAVNPGGITGLLIQARRASSTNTDPVGTFTGYTSDYKTLKCVATNDALTHANGNSPKSPNVTLTAPQTDVGDIEFVATVVETKTLFFMGVKSQILKYAASPTTQASSVATPGSSMTQASSATTAGGSMTQTSRVTTSGGSMAASTPGVTTANGSMSTDQNQLTTAKSESVRTNTLTGSILMFIGTAFIAWCM